MTVECQREICAVLTEKTREGRLRWRLCRLSDHGVPIYETVNSFGSSGQGRAEGETLIPYRFILIDSRPPNLRIQYDGIDLWEIHLETDEELLPTVSESSIGDTEPVLDVIRSL